MTRLSAFRAGACAAAAAAACLAAPAAHAQASSVTIYGSLDQYLNYMHSSSGTTIKSLEDGAMLRSRLGFRGVEDLGGSLSAKFQLEMGLHTDNGAMADTARSFDRQAWVGIGTRYGDFRFGRQNGAIFSRGGYIDHTTRTLGSIVNTFGVPSRYDNTLSFVSTRINGFQGDVFVSLPEAAVGNRAIVYQAGIDYATANYRLGYAGLRGRPPANAAVSRDVVYDNVFANWMYGKGTVYLAYVRSNNSTSSVAGAANGVGLNNGGTILGNVGGFNAGTSADLNNFYNILQISADYQVTPQFRVGALWGKIDDQGSRNRGATGGAVSAYYDFSKRTTLLGMVSTLRNDSGGGWRPAGSAGLKTNFTAANDVNGRTINGVHVGLIHRF